MRRYDKCYCPRLGALGLAAAAAIVLICGARGYMLSRRGGETETGAAIALYDREKGRIEEMPLEEYIIGVVGAEMPASFPLEALKAQAVAARTYAVRRMRAFGGGGCGGADICTDSGCCQSYKSPEQLREKLGGEAEHYMDKLRQAVYETEGEYAAYNGEPIEALYHSSAGGRTEDAQNVFSAALPYLIGVDSPGEETAGKYAAEVSVSLSEFADRVNKKWPAAGLKKHRLGEQVEIASRYDSGRVKELKLNKVTVSGRELRGLFGLNSANFSISIGERVTIRTRGYGHGVGMSQYGARAMALEGAGYEEILKHYYTGIEIARLRP